MRQYQQPAIDVKLGIYLVPALFECHHHQKKRYHFLTRPMKKAKPQYPAMLLGVDHFKILHLMLCDVFVCYIGLMYRNKIRTPVR